MAGLSDSVALFFKSPLPIKLHDFLIVVENPHKQKKTTYNGASTTFAVVAVENSHTLRVSCQKMCHFVANDKKSIERGSFVVLPVEIEYIFENGFVYSSTTDVDSNIFVMMLRLKELSYCVDIVTIEFFDS